MIKYINIAVAVYIAVISVIAVIITLYDKKAAKLRPNNRIPEKTLLTVAALGGSVAMFLTMEAARHKTKHLKFMIGIPLIIVLQVGAVIALIYFL